ncbi:hypothetical protein EGW08_017573 [Elysia chlorotica]|uniref:C2H2-type domain-containing protein n=1 Tax=Elysia chlorotica TaxID=188477 RepID=A0A3S0ZT64_ELYCH|nr:hypothetical protein EGW08_017573 [Elysia chlorotica]
MVEVYAEKCPNYSTVTHWVRKFKFGFLSVMDEPREGRPTSVVTEKNVSTVEGLVKQDRRITVKQLASETRISVGSVEKILHDHLNLNKVSARWVPSDSERCEAGSSGHVHVSRNVHIDDEIDGRIAKASAAFGRLRSSVWEREGVSQTTKIKVYRAVVLSTLLYANETRTVYQIYAMRLNRFHLCCLRKLLRASWQNMVPDTVIIEQSGIPSVFTLLRQTKLRWVGHVSRMSDESPPKRVLYGELKSGARSHGGQKKRFKDTLKASMKNFNIDSTLWEFLAQNRPAWREAVTKGAKMHEQQRIHAPKTKQTARKVRANCNPTTHATAAPQLCPHCNRYFRARIGLVSHLRTH